MSGSAESPMGLIGQVTGAVGPDTIGEVVVDIRGGSEAFYAYPAEGQAISAGATVLVVEYHPPREVCVIPWVDPANLLITG